VEGAEAPDEVYGVDADNFAGGEELGEDVEGDAVVGIVERWDEDQSVGDVEVGVAGGEALVAEHDRARQGQLDQRELLAGEGAGGFEADEVFGEGLVVGVSGVGLNGGDDGFRGDEAGDVVDVAVGVVAGDAAVEPEDLVNAEVVGENLLKLLTGESGVALLDLAEEALFGGEQDALAVGVDGAAF